MPSMAISSQPNKLSFTKRGKIPVNRFGGGGIVFVKMSDSFSRGLSRSEVYEVETVIVNHQ